MSTFELRDFPLFGLLQFLIVHSVFIQQSVVVLALNLVLVLKLVILLLQVIVLILTERKAIINIQFVSVFFIMIKKHFLSKQKEKHSFNLIQKTGKV